METLNITSDQFTQFRAQIILYCLYGSSLAYTGECLAIEHPQMWKYKPVFPRAYKRGCRSPMKR